jgi:Domain of unknown function (DUF1707)
VAYGPGQAYSPQPARPGPTQLGPAGAGPMVNPSWLAATADRERTVGTLRAGFAEGRLRLDELDERIAQAYAARTYADLWALTTDLPIGPYPFAGYGPPPGVVMTPDDAVPNNGLVGNAEASNWQSAAALLITALVIFTLAALVTAIVTAHVQMGYVSPASVAPGSPPQPGVIMPFQRVHVMPYVSAVGQGATGGPAGSGTQHGPFGHK